MLQGLFSSNGRRQAATQNCILKQMKPKQRANAADATHLFMLAPHAAVQVTRGTLFMRLSNYPHALLTSCKVVKNRPLMKTLPWALCQIYAQLGGTTPDPSCQERRNKGGVEEDRAMRGGVRTNTLDFNKVLSHQVCQPQISIWSTASCLKCSCSANYLYSFSPRRSLRKLTKLYVIYCICCSTFYYPRL